jgi:hypothetical protein
MGCNRQLTEEDGEVLKEAASVAALTGEGVAKAEQYVRTYGEERAKAELLRERLREMAHYVPPPPVGQAKTVPDTAPFANDGRNSQFWCTHIEEHVVDNLDERYGKPVSNQEEVIARKADGTCFMGKVDLLIDNKHVVDLKSHTMSKWSPSTAAVKGREFAEQVRSYLNGPTLAGRGGEGHIYMIGHPTQEPEVKARFEAAVAGVSDKINVVYVDADAGPEIITRLLYDTFLAK